MVSAFRALCVFGGVPAKGTSGAEMQVTVHKIRQALARGCICLGKGNLYLTSTFVLCGLMAIRLPLEGFHSNKKAVFEQITVGLVLQKESIRHKAV